MLRCQTKDALHHNFYFRRTTDAIDAFFSCNCDALFGPPVEKMGRKEEERVFTTRQRKDVIATQRIFYYIYSVDRVDVAL